MLLNVNGAELFVRVARPNWDHDDGTKGSTNHVVFNMSLYLELVWLLSRIAKVSAGSKAAAIMLIRRRSRESDAFTFPHACLRIMEVTPVYVNIQEHPL